jgi:signal transduction histidine kinase
MTIGQIIKKIPLFKECGQYNILLWQCPSFLFFILGALNIAAMLSTYFISTKFTEEPEITALITVLVSLVIFIIGTVVVQGFDKLLQANKMKTEFIRIASHQLRTPLSSLRWANDLLMEGGIGKPTEEQAEYLEIIRDSNKRMLKLINDLLDVTKIEMGNLGMDLKSVDLKEIIQEVIKGLGPLLKATNVGLNLKIEENLPLALSDPEKIRMVFSNLIDNSIKYSPGKSSIDVAAKTEKDYILVSVKDQGVGIPKAQQKNIFQKFFRSDNVMKHETVGSGLGLFIVKAIIESNHGSIWFESEENKGTVFYFKIPIADKFKTVNKSS